MNFQFIEFNKTIIVQIIFFNKTIKLYIYWGFNIFNLRRRVQFVRAYYLLDQNNVKMTFNQTHLNTNPLSCIQSVLSFQKSV